MTLEDRANDVLAKASVLAEGPAMRWEAPTSRGKAQDSVPTSEGTSTYDLVVSRIQGARSAGELERAIRWSELKLREIKAPARELTADQQRYYAIVASQGKDYRQVATENGMNETTVWRLRFDNGYEPRKGRPKEKAA